MKNIKLIIKLYCITWFLLAFLFITGCGKNSGNEQEDAKFQALKQTQKQEKESEKLKAIEDDIEALFEVLGGPSIKTAESGSEKNNEKQNQQATGDQDKSKQPDEGQKSNQQQSDQEQGTKDGQQDGQQQGTKDEQQGEQKKEEQDSQQHAQKAQQAQQSQQAPDKWSKADKLIQELHYKWNDLIPDLSKKNADIKLIDNFDNALNKLTTIMTTKDMEKVLTSANTLYSHIPDLFSLYRIKLSPEAKRMIYYTRNIILEATKNNWEQASKDIDAIEKSWSLFRNTLESEQKETGDKLNFSIYELKKVTVEKNKQLTDIKGKIVLSNIKDLQKSIEEKSKS